MKRCLILLLSVMMALPVFAQDSIRKSADTASRADSAPMAGNTAATQDSDGDASLLFLVMGIGFLAVLGVGIVATIALCAVAVMLTIGGILSFSFILGLYKRSLKTGVRWAVYLLFSAGGAGAGVLSYFIFRVIRKLHFHVSTPVLLSAAAGLVGGLICGAIFLMILRRMYSYLQNRLQEVNK